MAGTGRALSAAIGDSGSEITLTRTRPAKAGIVFVRLKSSVFILTFADGKLFLTERRSAQDTIVAGRGGAGIYACGKGARFSFRLM